MLGKKEWALPMLCTLYSPIAPPQPQPAHWLSTVMKETTYYVDLVVKLDATQGKPEKH